MLRPALALAAAALLAGCAGAAAQSPDWRPQPSFQGEGPMPSIVPAQPGRPSPSGGGSAPSAPGSGTTPSNQGDPAVVAKHLDAPTGIALLPDGTALVGERTTGRILRVQPRPNQPVQLVRTLTGLSTTGGGGLLDLALSPHYRQDALIFAYLSTPRDNRVVAFTLTGPVTPVVTGIPHGSSDNGGRIAFGPDGSLYVGTGDAGRPALAADPHSLAGKVLRVSDIGEPADGNPTPTSAVYTSGHRQVAGLCVDPDTGAVLEIDLAANGSGTVNLLVAGSNYGWPSATPDSQPPLASLPEGDTAPGGCTVAGHVLYVTSMDGRVLLAATLQVHANDLGVGTFQPSLKDAYGRLRTVVAAPDGALWLTTSNRDGHGSPVPDDERVLRIIPSGGGGAAPV
jgi:glucose/arabinose dehydrogenase